MHAERSDKTENMHTENDSGQATFSPEVTVARKRLAHLLGLLLARSWLRQRGAQLEPAGEITAED